MNVLFLTHRLPYAPNRGDRVRAFHLLRELSRWADVRVIALAHDAEEAGHAADLQSLARSVVAVRVPRIGNLVRAVAALPTQKPTTHSLLWAPAFDRAVDDAASAHKPDVVLAYCTGIAPAAFRPSLEGVPVVLDMVDVDSEKWASLAGSAAPPRSWIYAREVTRLRRFEARAAARSAATLVVNTREQRVLETIATGARIQVIENGVDVETLRPPHPPAAEPGVIFCGVMNYAPNVEGVRWLVKEVWPAVRALVPEATFKIVGAQPTSAVRALANPALGVAVEGSVPDVRPHLWEAAVAVAPLHTARGVQNKVLEAVSAGLPVVVTPAVMEGLPPEVRPACIQAGDSRGFADAIAAWLRLTAEARRAIASSARVEALTWTQRLAGLRPLLTELSGRSAG